MIIGRVATGIVIGIVAILANMATIELYEECKEDAALAITIVKSTVFAALAVYFLVNMGVL